MATSDTSHPLPVLPFIVIFVMAISLMLAGLIAFYPKYTWTIPIHNPPADYAVDLDLLQQSMVALKQGTILKDKIELELTAPNEIDKLIKVIQELDGLSSIRYVRTQDNQRIYTVCFAKGCLFVGLQYEQGRLPKLII